MVSPGLRLRLGSSLIEPMKGRHAKLGKVLVAAVLAATALIGCAGGPALTFRLTFKQGPEFSLGFSAEPATNRIVSENFTP